MSSEEEPSTSTSPIPQPLASSSVGSNLPTDLPTIEISKVTVDDEPQTSAASSASRPTEGDRESSVVKIQAPDFLIGRFIKFSDEHISKLSQAYEGLAKVTLRQIKGHEKIEFSFQPVEGLQDSKEAFEKSCTEQLSIFLDNYSCQGKLFNSAELAKVYKAKPEFFGRRTGEENEKLYVHWDQAKKKLTIAGLKVDVDSQMEDIAKYTTSRSSRYVYLFTSKQPVAWFLQRSSVHMKKLTRLFKELATVKISGVSNKDFSNLKLEFTSKPDVELPQNEFRDTCKGLLDGFLENYSFLESSFNRYQLEEVRVNDPSFFEQQQQLDNEDTMFYWKEDRLIISGLKDELKNQEKRIIDEINERAPRDMKSDYKIEIVSPDPSVAKFIYQSAKKHLKRFKNFFKNKINAWIDPQTYSIHFKADKKLSQFDIRYFQDKCRQSLAAFVRKYESWSATYSPETIAAAKKKDHDLFNMTDDDWAFETVDESHVNFVGLKPYFYAKRNLIRKALSEIEAERQKRVPLIPAAQLPPYRYEPNEKWSRTIIKHIFQSPLDLAALQHAVGPHVQFNVFPTEMDAKGIKFQPREGVSVDGDFYKNKIREILPEFFKRFLVCTKRFETDKFEQILSVVYRIGEASENVIDRMISMYKDENCLDIVGPIDVICEISMEVEGINCDQEEFDLTEDEPGPSTSQEPAPSTSHEPGPSTSHEPGPSALYEPGPSTSHEPGPSTSHEPGPSTSHEPGPSAPYEPGPSTSHEPGPLTSHEPGPSTSHEPGPSTSHEPGPSTSHEPGPSTSHEPGPSISHEPGPSTPREPGPSTSHEPGPSTSHEPGPSISHEPGPSTSHESGPSTSHEPGPSTSVVTERSTLESNLEIPGLSYVKGLVKSFRGEKPDSKKS